MKYYTILLIITFACLITSCNNSENEEIPIITSTKSVLFEEQGGEFQIELLNTNATVYKIVDNNNNVIYGNIYSPNNTLVKEDVPLSLTGLGSLKAKSSNANFSIERSTAKTLNVFMDENRTVENFSFTIILKLGEKEMAIKIRQNPSSGYDFKSIEYKIGNGNITDSIYSQKGIYYSLDDLKLRNFEVNPVLDSYQVAESYFRSNDKDAFYWAQKDAFSVETPKDIINGQIDYNISKNPYTNIVTFIPLNSSSFKVTIIPYNNDVQIKCYYMIEFRKRIIPYTLTFVNKHTKQEKAIEGEWVQIAPTGKYQYMLVIILDR